MKIVRIETLGCRLNQIESEAIAKIFLEDSFQVKMNNTSSSSPENKDTFLCILNTCAVTQKAEQKARRVIRLMLKKYPLALIIVTGCYAQLASESIKKIDKRICIVGGLIKSRLAQLPPLLNQALDKNDFNAEIFAQEVDKTVNFSKEEKEGYPEEAFKLSTSSFIAHSRASLKIQDGCNNNCSYCTIHIARGKSVSLDVETLLERVLEIEKNNNDEVVLTTVNIAQYRGQYKNQFYNFSQLLDFLLKNTSKINFRISSLYPQIVDDDFCKVISNERVRPHFHISVQSGSDKVLSLMNRPYSSEEVLIACKKIRAVKKDAFIACDIITGFPGENKADFIETMELCQKCNFAWVHVFPFSERPGTAAASMENKVPQSESGERAKRLTQWAINNKINYINSFLGQIRSGILEEVRNNSKKIESKNGEKVYHGMTDNFIHFEIITNKSLEIEKSVKVKIIKVNVEGIIKGGEIEALAQIVD